MRLLAGVLLHDARPDGAGGRLAGPGRTAHRGATPPGAASGYLLIPRLLGALGAGDPAGARDLAVQATELGNRFADPDLRAFGTLGHGQALIAMGDPAAGTARLDEVMVSVTAARSDRSPRGSCTAR